MISSYRYVFGSLVSGDFDSGSDTDVLVITKNKELDCPNDWSVYSEDGIKKLYRTGSLFAWHLYETAIPVTEETKQNDYLRQIGRPSRYTNAIPEIVDLQLILRAAFSELKNNTKSNIYEVGLIAVALRDIGMAASFHILGKFKFDKLAPLSLGKSSLNIRPQLYRELLNCRRSTIRGKSINNIDAVVTAIVKQEPVIEIWIDKLMDNIQEKP